MFKLSFSKNQLVDTDAIERAIEQTSRIVAKGVQADLEATQATWSAQNKAKFKIRYTKRGFIISTSDNPWVFLDKGTKPHTIRPKPGLGKAVKYTKSKKRAAKDNARASTRRLVFAANFIPKTAPGIIGSSAGGSSGSPIFAREVHHPGTKARNWSKIIKAKWDAVFPIYYQRAIMREVAKTR